MSLIEDMTEQNPWWSGTPLYLRNTVERDIFSKLTIKMDEKEVMALVGIRRSGKTTLMKQLIARLIDGGVDTKDILYFSFDLWHKGVSEVLKAYFDKIVVRHPSERMTFVFLDEVQNVPDWGAVVKSYYDKGYPIKFTVSGSSSFNILRGAGESLVGRISVNKVYPFNFREFLRYRGIEFHNDAGIPPEHGRLLTEFRRYLKMGSFPESYGKNMEEYLSTMIDLIFFRDIIKLLDVKSPKLLRDLFYSILEQSGNPINYAHLSRDTGSKYETVLSYMDYLEMAFLIGRSPLFPGKISQRKKMYKAYAGDHSFLTLADVPEGRILETLAFNHLSRIYNTYYWHNSGEVDIVLKKGKKIVPIEVSISEKKSPKHLLDFMDKFNLKKGYIITDGDIRTDNYKGKEIVRIPAYLFLLNSSNLL